MVCLGILVEEKKTYIFQIVSTGSPLSCILLICLISWIISLWLIIICCTLILETSVFKKVDFCYHVLMPEEFLYCVLQTWQGGTCSMVLHSKPQIISYNLSSQHVWYNQSFTMGGRGIKKIVKKTYSFSPAPVFLLYGVLLLIVNPPAFVWFFSCMQNMMSSLLYLSFSTGWFTACIEILLYIFCNAS